MPVPRTWRSSQDVSVLLEQVLPVDPDAYLLAVDYFASTKEIDPALAVWQRLVETKKPIVLAKSFPFLDELIAEDRSGDARKVWIDALALAGLNHDLPLMHSLIWNGDFAQDFSQGGLGWRWQPPSGVELAFNTVSESLGVRSVEIFFGGGTNLELNEPRQYVAAEPNRTYRFHAYIKTESITTEMGVRFSVVDPNRDGVLDISSENLTGSHPWTAVDLDVHTGPETHFLLVRLHRDTSRMFDNKLSGTVWIARVSLVPLETAIPIDAPAPSR